MTRSFQTLSKRSSTGLSPLLSSLLSAVLMAAPLACVGTAHADQLDAITAAKKIRIAIDLGAPPYSMKDEKLNNIGSDVEAAQLLAGVFRRLDHKL